MLNHNCTDYRENLLPGYSLGALTSKEQQQTEQHVTECVDCHQEVIALTDAVHGILGQAPPQVQPSPLLRTQFLAHLALEMGPDAAQTVPGRPLAAPQPPLLEIHEPPAHRTSPILLQPRAARWIATAAALPTVLALVFGVLAFNMRHQMDDEHSRLLALAFEAPHMAMPLQGPASAQGVKGELFKPTTGGNTGLLIVSGLHAPPAGMDYMCWVHRGDTWSAPGKLVMDTSGIAMMVFDHNVNLTNVDLVTVTMERGNQSMGKPSGLALLSTRL